VFNVVVTVEVKLGLKGEIRGNFEVARATQYLIMDVDVVLFYRFCAFIQVLIFFTFFGGKFP